MWSPQEANYCCPKLRELTSSVPGFLFPSPLQFLLLLGCFALFWSIYYTLEVTLSHLDLRGLLCLRKRSGGQRARRVRIGRGVEEAVEEDGEEAEVDSGVELHAVLDTRGQSTAVQRRAAVNVALSQTMGLSQSVLIGRLRLLTLLPSHTQLPVRFCHRSVVTVVMSQSGLLINLTEQWNLSFSAFTKHVALYENICLSCDCVYVLAHLSI